MFKRFFIVALCAISITACSQDHQAASDTLDLSAKAIDVTSTWPLSAALCIGLIPRPRSGDWKATTPYSGVITCRASGAWSAPAFIQAQLKNQPTKPAPPAQRAILFAIFSLEGLDDLLHNRLALFQSAEPGFWLELDLEREEEHSKADVKIQNDELTNQAFYQKSLPEIVSGEVPRLAEAAIFLYRIESLVAPPRSTSSAAIGGIGSGSSIGSMLGGFGPTKRRIDPNSYLRRITGTSYLLSGQTERPGYGLYSYVLIGKRPPETEYARFIAFFKSFIELPTASDLKRNDVPNNRVNVTLIPTKNDLEIPVSGMGAIPLSTGAALLFENYDYARAAAILSCLPKQFGYGPVIVSVLVPIDISKTPHPVFIEDLSLARPTMMTSYMNEFVRQTSREEFWNEPAMEALSLKLRNLLEVAADGLGLSREQVKPWLEMVK